MASQARGLQNFISDLRNAKSKVSVYERRKEEAMENTNASEKEYRERSLLSTVSSAPGKKQVVVGNIAVYFNS